MTRDGETIGRGASVALAACLAALVAPAAASAEIRYAEPNGDGPPASCPQTDPCALEPAVEDPSVADGDEVVVLPGIYSIDLAANESLEVDDRIDLHGTPGSFSDGRPTIIGQNEFGVIRVSGAGAGSRLADLELIHQEDGGIVYGFTTGVAPVLVERLSVSSPAADAACHFAPSGTTMVVRDTLCHNTSGAGAGIAIGSSPPGPATATLLNVTAISSGAANNGITTMVDGAPSLTVNAINTIAIGSGGAADVAAVETSAGPESATINLSHSNYDSVEAAAGQNVSVTAPGTATNQTAQPLLANAAGQFEQMVGSPTIDAGTPDPGLGTLDLQGEPRIQGPAPDIGADEIADTTAPALDAGARRRQPGPTVKVEVGCDEACSVELAGRSKVSLRRSKVKKKLKPVEVALAAGEQRIVKLKPRGRKAKKRMKRLLKRGGKGKVKISISASDAAANTSAANLKVTLRR